MALNGRNFSYFKTITIIVVWALLMAGNLWAQPGNGSAGSQGVKKARVIDHWTKDRMESATPRDLRIDPRGLGYLRHANGFLQPYGHKVAAGQNPQKGPPNNSDNSPPQISNMDPSQGETVGSPHTFSATITDPESGVKSATFTFLYPDGVTTQSFNANQGTNDVWNVELNISDGNWQWQVTAKNNGSKGGLTSTSSWVDFTVSASGGGGGGSGGNGDTITNAEWTAGGAVQTAMGRIYFEMPNNAKRKGPWGGYVCSGTVVNDGTTGRSVILTAAHCVYDDANKAFARNVLFIPNQADTTGSGTDTNCNNDPLGCWVPSFGVVDDDWSSRVFPNNVAWDYAYYVVSDSGAHSGNGGGGALDSATGDLTIDFSAPHVNDGVEGNTSNDFTHALGYSYSEDPHFMYCAEDMTTEGSDNWWLPSCGLSGGSSGGAWVQPMNTGTGDGPVISVNSWGYTTSPGMAGPILVDPATSAQCLYNTATSESFGSVPSADGEAGVIDTCF